MTEDRKILHMIHGLVRYDYPEETAYEKGQNALKSKIREILKLAKIQ